MFLLSVILFGKFDATKAKILLPCGRGEDINCQQKITRESETTESKQKMNSCGPEKKARKLHQRTDKLNRIPSRTWRMLCHSWQRRCFQ